MHTLVKSRPSIGIETVSHYKENRRRRTTTATTTARGKKEKCYDAKGDSGKYYSLLRWNVSDSYFFAISLFQAKDTLYVNNHKFIIVYLLCVESESHNQAKRQKIKWNERQTHTRAEMVAQPIERIRINNDFRTARLDRNVNKWRGNEMRWTCSMTTWNRWKDENKRLEERIEKKKLIQREWLNSSNTIFFALAHIDNSLP